MRRFLVVLALSLPLAGISGVGCMSKSSSVSTSEQDKVSKYVLDAVPADAVPVGINYDDKITLVAYKVSPPGTLKPGAQVQVTMYWRVDKELGEKGWGLFTHINDGAGKRILNIDNVGPLREWKKTQQLLPPGDWKTGKIYADEQTFTVPKKVKTSELEFTTGIWKGSTRLPIKSGPMLSDQRGLVVKLSVEAKDSKDSTTRVPQLRVDRLDSGTKIKIDGKLDEAAWKSASIAGPFVDVRNGDPNPSGAVNGSVRVLWDDKNIYLGFDVQDTDIKGGFKETDKDPHLWTKDTVEIMIDPDGDGDNKDYYEIQVNPQNLVFDSQFDSYNQPRKEPDGPFGHQEWSSNLESAVSVDGTLDKSDDKDKGYTVEIRLPWFSLGKAKKAPPGLGNIWRMNFYAMKDNGGVAWSPILGQGNFHKASRFGRVLWAEKGWKPAEDSAKAGDKNGDHATKTVATETEKAKKKSKVTDKESPKPAEPEKAATDQPTAPTP